MSITQVARTYIGTPWHHTGRLKGVGIDCAQLIYCTLIEAGYDIECPTRYSLQDEFTTLLKYIEEQSARVEFEDRQDGDILVFRARLMYNHCGFYTQNETMIHAYSSPSVMKVVEQPLNENWYKRLYGVYRVKEELWQHSF